MVVNMGDVTNTGKYTGGVIGSWDSNKTSLENAFNTGNVVVTGEDAADVGGIAGRFTGVNIKNCYHTTEYPLISNGEAEKDEITGKISNCYCMEKNTLPWDGEITKTTKAFTDGEVAYLLDGSGDSRRAELIWGQKIGTDQTPVLGGMTVYQDGSIYSNADGHHYGAPQYTWSESDMSCTARRICEGCENEESETVTASYTEEKAGCETNGKKEYKAEFKNPSFEVQTKTIMTDSLGHDVTDAVWSKDEKAHWKDCKNGCGKKLEQAEHTFQTIIDRQATESTEGSSHEECSVCGYQKAAVVIPVTGKEETTNEQPSNTNTLTVGQVVVNKADGSFYTIKKNAGKVHEVEYKAPKNKKQTKIAVPDSIKINGATYKVTSIAKSAFKNNKKLKTVTIGKNVSKIGENVFSGCKKLKTITIKSTKLKAKTLSKSTFKGITKATTVKVPKKKLSAYKKLFKSRGLSSKVKVKAY